MTSFGEAMCIATESTEGSRKQFNGNFPCISVSSMAIIQKIRLGGVRHPRQLTYQSTVQSRGVLRREMRGGKCSKLPMRRKMRLYPSFTATNITYRCSQPVSITSFLLPMTDVIDFSGRMIFDGRIRKSVRRRFHRRRCFQV